MPQAVAPKLGSDVPACLLSMTDARRWGGRSADARSILPELSGTPVLLINPRVPLSTADVFAGWDGATTGRSAIGERAATTSRRRQSRWRRRSRRCSPGSGRSPGASFVRMSGSGATCFALFDSEEARDLAAEAVPREWWRLATSLR